jgi:hypothetical protein
MSTLVFGPVQVQVSVFARDQAEVEIESGAGYKAEVGADPETDDVAETAEVAVGVVAVGVVGVTTVEELSIVFWRD